MNKFYSFRRLSGTICLLGLFISCIVRPSDRPSSPNVIVINLDDLGYGDISSYGATALATPNIDRLAMGGLRFTDGHSTSATCTPSRFALLTGVYPWRNANARILAGDAPLLIDTAMSTMPKLFKKAGYTTAVVGKWHLGLGDGNLDWNTHIAPGPNELGFDHSFIMAATQDRVPTVYIEDGYVVGLDPSDPIQVDYKDNFEGEPTAFDHPEMLRMKWAHGHNNSIVNGIPRIGYMKGGTEARWVDEDVSDTFFEKVRRYIQENRDTPFFLYYALQQPHVPRTPDPRFVGKTSMGPRGDAIIEADWYIGALLDLLEEMSLTERTLLVFTSDNGPVVNDGYQDDAVERLGNHRPGGMLRGGKYSLFEAGTRVPFITYWPGVIKPGVSDALVSQMDLLASFGQLVGVKVADTDSQDLLATLLGNRNEGRNELVMEAGRRTAFRQGKWVMIPPYPGPPIKKTVAIETGNGDQYQLYDLENDLSQRENVALQYPEKLQELIKEYEKSLGND